MNTRFKPSRDFYIPKGSTQIDAGMGTQAVVYTWERTNDGARVVYLAMGFAGRAQKPSFHYRFPSLEARGKHIADFFAGQARRKDAMAERKAERKAEGRGLDLGDVLLCSWGYDQTNIDYFEVTKLIGNTMVEIRELAAESVETASMQGESVPLPGKYLDKTPLRRIAKAGRVKIFEWGGWASKMEPHIVAGVKVYRKSHWTAYA